MFSGGSHDLDLQWRHRGVHRRADAGRVRARLRGLGLPLRGAADPAGPERHGARCRRVRPGGVRLGCGGAGTRPLEGVRAACHSTRGERTSLERLGYHPPRVHDYLHRFTTMVESCPPPADSSAARGFPSPDEAAMAPCVRHRVLSALPLRDGCLLCNRPHYQPARFHIRRALPADFPPFQTVFRFFSRWRAAGIFNLIRDQLRRLVRRAMGALPHPVAAVIDSRSVKVAATVPRSTSGYDAGKKLPGRKRDIVVGMEGLLQALPTARSGVVRAVPCRRPRPRSTEGRVTRADRDP